MAHTISLRYEKIRDVSTNMVFVTNSISTEDFL